MEDCKWCNSKDNYLKLKEYLYWNLYLSDSQLILGWCRAVLKRHMGSITDLTREEQKELLNISKDIKFALKKTFNAYSVGIMQMGAEKHLCLQLVPTYKEPREYDGRKFVSKPGILSGEWKTEDKEFLTKLADCIRKNIKK